MLVKLGVDVSKLRPEIRRTLKKVERVFVESGYGEAVITDTDGTGHSPSSYHYANQAYDVRLPTMEVQRLNSLLQGLKSACGLDYDVVLEGNHFHVEYDPD